MQSTRQRSVEGDATHLELHELVERFIPLHEQNAVSLARGQVLVPVIRVPDVRARLAALSVGYFRCGGELPIKNEMKNA